MTTRRNDFASAAIDKSRSAAVFEIGPAPTMPQIIIGSGPGGEPALNRPYDCVLIIEGHTFVVSACTHGIHRRTRNVDDCSLPAARTDAYFSRNDPIDKLRNFTSATRSDIALLDSPMRRDARSRQRADIKKKKTERRKKEREKREEGRCGRSSLENAARVLSRPILLRALYRYSSSRAGMQGEPNRD